MTRLMMKLAGWQGHAELESTPDIPNALAGILAIPSRMLRSWRDARRYKRAMEELTLLDDRTLRDIGVNRCEIPRVAQSGRTLF